MGINDRERPMATPSWKFGASALLALVCGFIETRAVNAQSATDPFEVPGELIFCPSTGGGCFGSLPEAERAMRSATADVGHLLELSEISLGYYEPHYFYKVPDQAPASYGAPYYTVPAHTGNIAECPVSRVPTGTPQYYGDVYCYSESELVEYAIKNILFWSNCSNYAKCTDFSVVGEYTSPYSEIVGSRFFHMGERRIRYRTESPSGVGEGSFRLVKEQPFTCPKGTQAIRAAWDSPKPFPNVCRTSIRPYIKATKWRQVNSCLPNKNPCNPATGDKSRAEVDATFGGRAFTRFYHSLREIEHSPSKLGVGWTHTFSATAQPYMGRIFTSRGHVEQLESLGNSRFALAGRSGAVIEPLPDGGWKLTEEGGDVTTFAQAGYLTSLSYPGDPSRRVFLVYENPTSESRRLIKAVDAEGRSMGFSYDDTGLLSEVRLPDGTSVRYDHDSHGNLTHAIYADGQASRYFYGEPDLAPNGDKHLLTGISYETGKRHASFGYDAYGRVKSSVLHSEGAAVDSTKIYYTAANEAIAENAQGKRTRYVYAGTSYRSPVSVTDVAGSSSNTYDNYGRLLTSTDRRGTVTRNVYSQGRVTERVEAASDAAGHKRTTQFDWDTALIKVTEQRTLNAVGAIVGRTSWSYNARGQRITSLATDPVTSTSRSTSFTYCEQPNVDAGTCPRVGLLLSVDGPRTDIADITRYTYYPSDAPGCDTSPATCAYRKGDLWAVENAMGHITETLRYDGAGRPLQTKDANGVVTDLEYHPRGWLTSRKVRGDAGSGDAVMRIDYWPTGLVKQVTQPDGTFTTCTYDDAHRLTAIADNAGNRIEYTLDNAGNRTKEDTRDAQGALKRTLSRVYNQLGQLQTARDAYSVATGFTYDASGNTDTVTDAKNRVTDNDYDPLNRLTRTLQDTAGIRAETKFEYDALDNLTRVVDPKGLATTYTYNGLGDLTQLTSPDTGTTTYTYDSAGNRASQTNARGITTQYLYDALNRLTQVLYASPSLNTTYYYDTVNAVCAAGETFALGRLGRMADASGSTQYCYDRWGNLVRKVQTTNGRVFTTRYAYNLAGRLTRMVYPSGMVVDYGINSLGQPSSITVTRPGQAPETLVRSVKYHAFGPVSEIAYGTSGRVQRRGVDANYRPNVVEDGVSLNLGLGWDEVGNLTSLVDTHPSNAIAAPLRGFRYDALNRLDQVRNGATNSVLQTYTYDATGNRTSFKSGTSTTQAYTYPTTSHRLTQAGTTARTYDAVGNTVSIGGTAREFIFDATNRMSQLKKNGAVSMNYAYNGKGERVRRFTTATSTAQTYSVYDEAGHWIGEYNSSGARLQEYIWLDDLPVGLHAPTPASTTTFQLYHVQADHLGTPRTVIDPVRNVAVWNWALTGEAFGNSTPVQDPDADGKTLVLDMRFPGQRYDSATLLNYNYFRDYEAGTGRYVESDPIGLNGGASTYGYVLGSPLHLIDPDGQAPRQAFGDPTAACAYYDRVNARTGGRCGYYSRTGPFMCRNPYSSPFLWGVPRGQITCVRVCLIAEDKSAWLNFSNLTSCPTCLKDDVIDNYHDRCYTKCGVSTSRYPGVRPMGVPLGNEW